MARQLASTSGLNSTDGNLFSSGNFRVFANGSYINGQRDSEAGQAGFNYDGAAALGGVDYAFTPNIFGGIAFTYATIDADLDRNIGSVNSDSYGVAIYGGAKVLNKVNLDGVVNWAWNEFDYQREAGVGTARADTDGDSFGVSGQVGYDFSFFQNRNNALTVTPFARLTYGREHVDGFRETGAGNANLIVDDITVHSLRARGGVSFEYRIPLGEESAITPNATLAIDGELLNQDNNISAAFTTAQGQQFTQRVRGIEGAAFAPEIGFTADISNSLETSVEYRPFVDDDLTEHVIEGAFRIRF